MCTWYSFFQNVLASLFVGFSTVSTAFVSESTRYLTTIQQSRTASKRRTALFFFFFESSARFQRAERRWNVSYPRFFSSYARKHVYGGFVHVSWTFLLREMTCERRIRNLRFQKSQRANSALFDDVACFKTFEKMRKKSSD